MYEVSARFAEVVTGSHRAVSRVQVLTDTQFGTTPTGGIELPLLGGDVKLGSTSDVKATLSVTVPGDYWELCQPYGNELFVERGIDFGDGTRELVPLGYYRIDEVVQDDAPWGPIRVTCSDRIKQMQQNRVLYPYQVPAGGLSHRVIFHRLVNGDPAVSGQPSQEGYGMYIYHSVPIHWQGYDPDTTIVPAGQVVEDSTYEFLAKLAAGKGCVLIFDEAGELWVTPRDRDPSEQAVYTLRTGRTGTLVRASRSVSREGVYNIVSAYGSDSAHPTGYQLAYNNDRNSPLFWSGKFGAAPRYYASPVLKTAEAVEQAAATVLARYTGLPSNVSVWSVPHPALRPLDVVDAAIGTTLERHVIDNLTVPLVGDAPLEVVTRQLNPVGSIETQPDPTPTPDPDPGDPGNPGNPDPGPGGPEDGTQAAAILGWGPVVDGDEFQYTGAPSSAKWVMYDGPGHAGNGRRTPSAFSVANGILTCYGNAGGDTGGMAFRRDEYGCRIEVRMRTYSIDPGAGGNRYHPVLITWPTSDEWPAGAEYDFFETNCDSGKAEAYLHYPNHQPIVQEYASKPMDIQNWHNYAFEWNPSARTLKSWIDGEYFFEFSGRVAEAPGPMHLTFQLDAFYPNGFNPAKMEAMWVRIYNRPNA
ncbi:DUF5047 domain-containing protein [Pseudonocardia asaccharolytica]|uniref:GH16 domain-containing protein n=1 Tax=Pseudonocardia asaccharolytica DSM 44247 = NBRC 16224 TaxID=1123024 RepID=A0A511CYZ3_9PSEU|nr:DUF5047 domain-containing protein [Pseudonocardia asaccharolytica]GEL17697.1 hypothetical protein PA7_15340 [Pseudonocardia asaccharolytica DSM 44247 = NBRC 16224]